VVYAPERGVLGVIHAGWRGLTSGVLHKHFRVLEEEWNVTPAEVFIGAGPSLCQRCSEFTNPAEELRGIDPKFFDGRLVDLQGIATDQLISLGVPPERIERHPDCTRCKADVYWSYRADAATVKRSGRNVTAAFIGEM
jgi:hypothetical protein